MIAETKPAIGARHIEREMMNIRRKHADRIGGQADRPGMANAQTAPLGERHRPQNLGDPGPEHHRLGRGYPIRHDGQEGGRTGEVQIARQRVECGEHTAQDLADHAAGLLPADAGASRAMLPTAALTCAMSPR